MVISRSANSVKIAPMMASPPANTGSRSSRRPGRASFLASPAAIACSRSHSSPSAVMPRSARPEATIASESERALPEDPTASRQPVFSKRDTMVCTCARAASSAAFIDFLSMRPSGKKRCVQLTQPRYRLSITFGRDLAPMMNSVDPPPMSITRRSRSVGGRDCTTPA